MLSAVNWYRYSSTRPGTHFMVVAEASTLQTAVAFFAGDTHFSFCRVHSSSIRMCVYATSFVPGIFYQCVCVLLCAAAVLVAPYVFRIYFWRRIFVFCIFYLLEYSDNRSASVLRSI